MKKYGICLALILLPPLPLQAQNRLSMQQAIFLAQEHSIQALSNRNIFAAAYWSYRSFKAELLPSLSLSAGLGNFNRSLVQLQDFNTGRIGYRANYTLSNDATLYFSQNIPWTGGTLSLSTSLSRLDQYSPERLTTYFSQPLYLSYAQSLWGYNRFKWERETHPKQYEAAKREYMESMEQVSQTAVTYFWNYAMESENHDRAVKSFEESRRLYTAAAKRFDMGTLTREELLQIEVRMLNDSLAVNACNVSLECAKNSLCSFIGYKDNTRLELDIDYELPPGIALDCNDVIDRALRNSSFLLNQKITSTQSDQSIAQAKAGRGIQASISARLGISGSDERFGRTFAALQDQEIVGISLSVPLLDWGLGEGRVRMAKAQARTTRNSLEQSMSDWRQELQTRVIQFNNQYGQCEISRRAALLARESYELALESFGSGSMTMTQLDLLKEKRDNAMSAYLGNVASWWNQYYGIRCATLYDYITNTSITAQFNAILNYQYP